MSNVDAKQVLLGYYQISDDISDIAMDLSDQLATDTDFILGRVASNKGVYTVLITLALYKAIHPEQDIRYHKIELANGFSGRSFDTKYITPTLKELNLPAMSESGWLTRSLEQAYPYDMDFKGKITPDELKWSFLRTVATIQSSKENAETVLRILLNGGIQFRENNRVDIKRIESDDIQIAKIIQLLEKHFTTNYNTRGGSKLPVLAFYAIYSMIIPEMGRYINAKLLPLGSHTASDRTSRSAGDIEVARDDKIFEAVEIKLDKPATAHMLRVAYEKINKFGVSRYYILSGVESELSELQEMGKLILDIEEEHGCQVIVNGLYQSLKYYLRLVSSPQEFLNRYAELVESDTELEIIHKNALNNLISEYFD
ncbi:MAG: restriction endonuclease, SacI family [Candidatus Saccharibacteria bacterium]|nr:restriction endonuclease, SacI family [Candidatus Saccharibacteria bacterium]